MSKNKDKFPGIVHAHIWPDGTWCWEGELEEMGYMSDDSLHLTLPEWADDDDVEMLAEEVQRTGTCDVAKFFGLA